jgi:hypothetical protein
MKDDNRRVTRLAAAIAACLVAACGCGGASDDDTDAGADAAPDADSDTDSDADADSDADTDTDTDTDSDTDTDTDSDTDTDTDTDVDTDDCVESELPPSGYWDFYDFCVPVDDACIDEVDVLIAGYGGFEGACNLGSAGWIGCDTTTEHLCMLDPASSVSMDLLCALSLLDCVTEIGGGFWE